MYDEGRNIIWISECWKKVKWSRYRPGMVQRVGRGIALLFHDRGTRRWVSGQLHAPPFFTPGKNQVPIVQEAGWTPRAGLYGRKISSCRDSIPDRPASHYIDWATRPTNKWMYFLWNIINNYGLYTFSNKITSARAYVQIYGDILGNKWTK